MEIVAGLVALGALVIWLLVANARKAGAATAERQQLEVDHAKQAAAAEVLSGPLLTGSSLRARMRARLRSKSQGSDDPPVPDSDPRGD